MRLLLCIALACWLIVGGVFVYYLWEGNIREKPIVLSISANGVMAFCSIILMVITGYYAVLTSRIQQLQVEPYLEVGFSQFTATKPEITISNSGAIDAMQVSVNLRSFSFTGSHESPMTQFAGFSGGGANRSWWFLQKVRPGEALTKDATVEFSNFLYNAEQTDEMAQRQLPATQPPVKPKYPMLSHSFVVVDITYHRSIDNKTYRISKPAWLARNSATGKAFLMTVPVSLEYERFLRELDGIE